MKSLFTAALLLLTPLAFATPPKFYAYCVEAGVTGLKARPLSEQAKLLRELGFDGTGLALPLGDGLEANLKLLDEAGLQAFLFWMSVNLSKTPSCDPKRWQQFASSKDGLPPSACCSLE